MSNAVDRARERRDDQCPACGEGIDWGDGSHWMGDEVHVACEISREVFDVAVLDLAHLND